MVYIRQEQLPKLKEYKYAGVDHSLVSRYVLKPFYTNVVIKCFPMWMAPNMITLLGFSFVIVNFLTLLWYNPSLDQDCPQWVYLSWAAGLFLYQTFDAVDGQQARRTHQSGPLGELFDHGVDACNTSLEVLLFAGTMNLGQGWKTVLTLFGCLSTFYTQTWDEYHTHTLTLGLISGPVEGVLSLCIVFAITALKGGGSFWTQPMLSTMGVPPSRVIPSAIYNLAWNEAFILYGGSVLVFNTVQSAMNVMNARRSRNQNPTRALMGFYPFVLLWILTPIYLALQPSILYHHIIPFVLYIGLVNAYSVGQIIVAHLTKARFPYQNILITPLTLGVLDSIGPFLTQIFGFGWPSALGDDIYQVAYLFLCFGLALGVYGSFVVDVIVAICDYMDIWCLTIKHPWNEEEEARKDGKQT
ncbi:MAG: hypothetical protein M1831_002798 [Alyxoria varia]|nr:MAG: hypothetical protein M1831_002798 [Alyxoria varia]